MTTEVETPTATIPEPAEAAPSSLFKYSAWVHAGHGADECTEVDEETGENRCSDPSHFHAWVRLPNQFQEREIRERAQAARARRQRQLRTQGTDSNDILETAIEDVLALGDDAAKEKLADELIAYDWAEDYLGAINEAKLLEDDSEDAEEDAKLFAHIEDDQARFTRLATLPEEERNSDEFQELEDHLQLFEQKVNERFEAIRAPKRESYLGMDVLDLSNLARRKRIDRAGHEEFMHTYSTHEWLSCTFKQPEGDRVFRDLAHLEASSSVVLDALNTTFGDLERLARESAGN